MTAVDMLAAALDVAEQGVPVFPCKPTEPKAKSPLTQSGFKEATTDAAKIRAWWEIWPDALIGVPTGKASGFWALDVDEPDLFRERCAIELPVTRQVKTGKGFHFYWRFGDIEVRNAQKNSGSGWAFPELPGADVRGEGGYVIVPPSAHPSGLRYELIKDVEIVDAPAELLRIVSTKQYDRLEAVPVQNPPTLTAQSLRDVRSTNYGLSALEGEIASITSAPNGAQEATLNASALKIGSLVAGGELSMEAARQALIAAATSMFTYRSQDPWTIDNVTKKVERGLADGAKLPRTANNSSKFQSVTYASQRPIPHFLEYDVYKTLNLTGLDSMPPMRWRIKDLVPKQGLVFIYGQPGHHKTFVTVDMALRCAHGLDWHGRSSERCGVLYIAGEGQFGVTQRIKGWCKKHQLEAVDAPFTLLPTAVHLLEAGCVDKLKRTIDQVRRETDVEIGLVVVDTVSRSIPGQDENSQETMSKFIDACADIQSHCGGTVIGVHHSGKDGERGMRGSSVLLGGCDTAISIAKKDEVTTLSVKKQKDGDEIDDVHFAMELVDLANGIEPVRTLVPALSSGHSPIAERDLSRDQIDEIFASIDQASNKGQPWSVFAQAKSTGRHAATLIAYRYGISVKLATSYLQSWLTTEHLIVESGRYAGRGSGLRVVRYIERNG